MIYSTIYKEMLKWCWYFKATSQLRGYAHRTAHTHMLTHTGREISSENEQSANLPDNTQGDSLSAIWLLTE